MLRVDNARVSLIADLLNARVPVDKAHVLLISFGQPLHAALALHHLGRVERIGQDPMARRLAAPLVAGGVCQLVARAGLNLADGLGTAESSSITRAVLPLKASRDVSWASLWEHDRRARHLLAFKERRQAEACWWCGSHWFRHLVDPRPIVTPDCASSYPASFAGKIAAVP